MSLGNNFLQTFQAGQKIGQQVGLQRDIAQAQQAPGGITNEQLGNILLKRGQTTAGTTLINLAQQQRAAKLKAEQDLRTEKINFLRDVVKLAVDNKDNDMLQQTVFNFREQSKGDQILEQFADTLKNVEISENNKIKISNNNQNITEESPLFSLTGEGTFDTVSEYDPSTGKTNIISITSSKPDESLKRLEQATLDLQKKGYNPATQEQIQSLPSQALVTIGEGENTRTFVKPAKTLTTTQATALSSMGEAKLGYEDILSELEKAQSEGKLDEWLKVATSRAGLTKVFSQKYNSILELGSESIGRAMSGAAVPETEVKRFKSMYSVNATDKPETMIYKLKRTINIMNDTEVLSKYGAPIDDKKDIDTFTQNLKQAEKELQTIEKQEPTQTTEPTQPSFTSKSGQSFILKN